MSDVIGLKEIERAFGKIEDIANDRAIENGLYEDAIALRDMMRSKVHVVTGNLQRGIVAKKFSRQVKNRPAVFVAIDYRIAPHAHLVEYGTRHMSAHPFWRPSVIAYEQRGLPNLTRTLQEELDKIWR